MSGDLTVRVRVLDAWEDIRMLVPASTSIAAIKLQALDAANIAEAPDQFQVKFRGAAVRDESRSLADERVPSEGALIVMRRRRVAVR